MKMVKIAHALRTVSLLAMAAAAIAAPASAQESQTTTSTDPTGIEEIVVTAQYRSESLQKVPLAVSSVSGTELANAGVSDLTGLSGSVPGLYFSSYSTISPQVFIRGVGSNDDGITAEGAVGTYIDGVYAGRGSSALFDLFDLERVEVLRGPQGTLYGRNTNGGAIKIETTKPGPDLRVAIEAGYGNYDQRTVRALVSGPLSGNVFAKLSGSYKKRDGWTRDEVTGAMLNDEDSLSARGQIRFEPSEEIDVTLSADYARDRPTSTFKEVVGGSLFGLYTESPNPFAGSYDLTDAVLRRDIFGASAVVNWDVGIGTLTGISGYRKTDIHYTEDYDSTPFPVVNIDSRQEARQFTQELRLVSNEGDGAFSWIVGGFYLNDRGRGDDLFLFPFFGLDDLATLAEARTSSIAGFGELSYRIVPKLKVTLGGRYTHERKRLTVQRIVIPFDGSAPFDFVQQTSAAVSFDNFSPRFLVEYQANDDVLAYASVTRGFKSGGFNNYPADVVAATTPFSPEKITAYEAGLKATMLDRKLRINTAMFYYDYKNLQVFAPINTGGGAPVVQITNAAKARVKGLETEITLNPVNGLTVELNYAHLLSNYRDFLFGTADLSGNRLPRAPRDTVRASIEWKGRIAGEAELRLGGEYIYSSNLFFTPFNDPDLQTGNVGIFNASATVTSGDGRWKLTLYGRNLANKKYLGHGIDVLANDFDLKTGQVAPPRQYGATVGWHF